jgi:hypothetical protein
VFATAALPESPEVNGLAALPPLACARSKLNVPYMLLCFEMPAAGLSEFSGFPCTPAKIQFACELPQLIPKEISKTTVDFENHTYIEC